ncbi:MAG TPA: HIT family protein [Bacillota bacterium]|nr:HIT family protein [Bacillota bacterium]
MAEPTLYDKIIDGSIPSFKVWENDAYIAFLTPFANTPGFTVVTPKQNPGANFLDVDDGAYVGLLVAARTVAKGLKNAFGLTRVGLVIEGEGVPHLHVKLIPMHGLGQNGGVHATHTEFYENYPGYLTTIEGPRMADEALRDIQQKIIEANK